MTGRLRHKGAVYTPQALDDINSDLNRTIGDYNSYISKLLHDNIVWRLIALIGVASVIVSILVLILAVKRPQTELVVIGVNDLGETKYYGKSSGLSYQGYDMKEYIIKNILQNFIKETYIVTADSEYMYNNFIQAMNYLQADKRRYYELDIKETDPFKLVGLIKRDVSIETIIPVSNSTYQADWYNIESDMNGYGKSRKHMRGIFTFTKINSQQYNSLSEDQRVKNPLGIFINDYSIVEVEDK